MFFFSLKFLNTCRGGDREPCNPASSGDRLITHCSPDGKWIVLVH